MQSKALNKFVPLHCKVMNHFAQRPLGDSYRFTLQRLYMCEYTSESNATVSLFFPPSLPGQECLPSQCLTRPTKQQSPDTLAAPPSSAHRVAFYTKTFMSWNPILCQLYYPRWRPLRSHSYLVAVTHWQENALLYLTSHQASFFSLRYLFFCTIAESCYPSFTYQSSHLFLRPRRCGWVT